MAYDFDGSTQGSYVNIGLGYPLTFSAWFNVDTLTNPRFIAGVTRSNGYTIIGMRLETTGALSAFLRDNTSAAITTYSSTTTVSTGGWNHAAVVFTSASSRKVYLNGVLELTDTTANSYGLGPNRFSIGSAPYGSGTLWFDGKLAEVAFWSDSLNDSEILGLSKGMKPSRFRTNKLECYPPLVRNTVDVMVGQLLLLSTPAVADHPRVY